MHMTLLQISYVNPKTSKCDEFAALIYGFQIYFERKGLAISC